MADGSFAVLLERELFPFFAPNVRAILARAVGADHAGEGDRFSMVPSYGTAIGPVGNRRSVLGGRPLVVAEVRARAPWQEVRLRAGRPLMVVSAAGDAFLAPDGVPAREQAAAYHVTGDDVRRTLELMSGSSLYAWEEELRQGFITLPGGHRVGLCGRVVLRAGQVQTMKDISSMNVRIAREVPGAAEAILPWILGEGGLPANTLVYSPPGAGKTTLLRELVRQISRGRPDLLCPGLRVGVVDERSEIGGTWQGRPTRDLGPRADILDGCPKAVGMALLVRAMGPQVLVTDEIGRPEDAEAIAEVLRCGVRVLASAHAGSLDELLARPTLMGLIGAGAFDRLVRLGTSVSVGTVEEVRDGAGRLLFGPGPRPRAAVPRGQAPC